MPFYRTVGVCINLHEKLIELFGRHILSNNLSKGFNELINFKGSSLIGVCNIKCLSELHDMLKINPLTRVLFPIEFKLWYLILTLLRLQLDQELPHPSSSDVLYHW